MDNSDRPGLTFPKWFWTAPEPSLPTSQTGQGSNRGSLGSTEWLYFKIEHKRLLAGIQKNTTH